MLLIIKNLILKLFPLNIPESKFSNGFVRKPGIQYIHSRYISYSGFLNIFNIFTVDIFLTRFLNIFNIFTVDIFLTQFLNIINLFTVDIFLSRFLNIINIFSQYISYSGFLNIFNMFTDDIFLTRGS